MRYLEAVATSISLQKGVRLAADRAVTAWPTVPRSGQLDTHLKEVGTLDHEPVL